jgi:hypothetical protein
VYLPYIWNAHATLVRQAGLRDDVVSAPLLPAHPRVPAKPPLRGPPSKTPPQAKIQTPNLTAVEDAAILSHVAELAFQSPVKCSPRNVERLGLEGQIVKALDDCTVLTYDRLYAYPQRTTSRAQAFQPG